MGLNYNTGQIKCSQEQERKRIALLRNGTTFFSMSISSVRKSVSHLLSSTDEKAKLLRRKGYEY